LHPERQNASRARRRARPRRPPPYAPYPLWARTPRRRCDRRSVRSIGEHPCVPSVAPSAACHWPPARRTSPAMPSPPLRGLAARHVPTYPNRPSRAHISRSSPSLVRMPACPSRRRPPLPPLGEHCTPLDFLTHQRASALPCALQHLPEPCVDHAEPPLRRSPSLRGRRRTAAVELAPPPLLQAP
jgi:hypothetical protein